MADKKSPRAKRTDQVLHPAGNFAFGNDIINGLIESAQVLLLRARNERGRGDKNFLTSCGPGAILLAFTALESFVNDTLHSCLRLDPKESFERLVNDDNFIRKFHEIPALITGRPRTTDADLELVHQVRHEIVHYYPRHVGTDTHVPEWLQPLVDKNLLVQDIGWQQKLESYALARWCTATVTRAAEDFANALQGEDKGLRGHVASLAKVNAQNFRLLMA